MLVGDTNSVEALGPGLCDLPNQWPMNLARHMEQQFGNSIRKLDVPRERVARLQTPVLTIHGTSDRNAPYGAGREWVDLLPNARLMTLPGAAHQVVCRTPEVVRPAVAEFLRGTGPPPPGR